MERKTLLAVTLGLALGGTTALGACRQPTSPEEGGMATGGTGGMGTRQNGTGGTGGMMGTGGTGGMMGTGGTGQCNGGRNS